METEPKQKGQPVAEGLTDEAVVGLLSSGSDAPALATAVLRARSNGHDVLITYQQTIDEEVREFTRELGVPIVASDCRTNEVPRGWDEMT